jgi:hypothetical protein
MSEEEFLKKHIEEMESSKKTPKSSIQPKSTDNSKISDIQFFNFDVKELPCGKFYPPGTMFMIRPAQVKEIQAYSMVDDNNFYDVIEKMNDILRSCVRVKYSNGEIGTYLDVKDQDRIYLVFMIRELTFQQGNSLSIKVTCKDCGTENEMELIRKNFRFHEFDEKLMKYYDKSTGSFTFKTKSGDTWEVTPPNIGIQKAFTDYIIKENSEKKTPNLAFLKIIPFLLNGQNTISYEDIKKKLVEFEKMDDMNFQFLNAAISKMTFGIKELSKKCESCGLEIRTDMQFPNGASGIFVIHDAFEAFIEE